MSTFNIIYESTGEEKSVTRDEAIDMFGKDIFVSFLDLQDIVKIQINDNVKGKITIIRG